ncbi:hypothetical protein N0V90_008774 [Kalmusia sp. IMI 367209]|nr:hypothetical protein N0V90_008774 [Kalmusia sp. IMI 367209]
MSPTSVSRNLDGKNILITGASSGIGRSTALEFARTSPFNLKLILTARRVDRLLELKEKIRQEVGDGVKVCIKELDVSKKEEIDALVEGLPEEFRDVDVLVNNAYVMKERGGFMSGVERPPDVPPDVISSVYATNVMGVIHMTQAILPILKRRPDGGKGDIIMLGSIAGRDAYVGGTEFTNIRYRFDKEKADAVYAGCDPLTPEDVAEVIVFAAGRRENVVIADTLLYPSYQASSTDIHRR